MFDSIIAKEGQKSILIAFLAMIVFVLIGCGLLRFISFVVFVFLIYVYRYKYLDFTIFKDEDFFAPISGKVTAIDTKDLKKSVYIEVSLCDSHILRSMESGHCKLTLKRGLNLLLNGFKANTLNEQARLDYKNSSMQLISSICNSDINIEKVNDLIKGEKIGVFLQGQVIVTFNSDINTIVEIGDKIVSGKTLIAKKVNI